MKRLLLILLTIPLLAAGPEPQWKETRGKWERPTPTSFRSQFGYLEYQLATEPEEWQVSLNITILSWGDSDTGLHLAGVMWGPPGNTNGLFLSRGEIRLVAVTGNSGQPVRASWSPPLKRRIGMTLQITPEGVRATVGGQRINSAFPCPSVGSLRLHVNGADAIFDAIRIK